MPGALPESADDPICTVLLCTVGVSDTSASAVLPECFEARMQRHHLQGPAEAWCAGRLDRLMTIMALPSSDDGGIVLLRREAGRMVIDVVICGGSSRPEDRMVEILNAYPPGTSLRGSATCMLRSLAHAQRAHQARIGEAQVQLEEIRKSLEARERQWDDARTKARDNFKDLLRRFYLLLQAKIDKEGALHSEAMERHRALRNTLLPANGNINIDNSAISAKSRSSKSNGPAGSMAQPTTKRRREHMQIAPTVDHAKRPAPSIDFPEPPAQVPLDLAASAAKATMSLFDPMSSDDEAERRGAASELPHAPAVDPSSASGVGCVVQQPAGSILPVGSSKCEHPARHCEAWANSLFDSDNE